MVTSSLYSLLKMGTFKKKCSRKVGDKQVRILSINTKTVVESSENVEEVRAETIVDGNEVVVVVQEVDKEIQNSGTGEELMVVVSSHQET